MLAPKTFSIGGIHPPSMKYTADKSVVRLPLPDKVILHLSQHIGAPAKSIPFEINDRVNYGQIIAEAGGFVSAPIHATISGRVIALGNFKHPLGQSAPAIVIERDKEAVEPKFEKKENGLALPPSEILQRIKNAGIVGLGGAAFPTHVKLSPPPGVTIDTIILNGAECEPCLTSDHRMMLEESEKIIDGLRLAMKVVNAKHGYIAIEDNKQECIEKLDSLVSEIDNIDVQPLITKYPQGGEKQLIYAVTGREVPNGKLPSDVGVVVMNVTSAEAVSDAVNYGMPLSEKTVTLAGECVKNPGNYRVRIGTPISDFIQMTGGLKEDVLPLKKVILGGPMMGFALYDLYTPIVKGTSGILCWSEKEAQPKPRTGCLRCGKCVEACPMGLEPLVLDALINAGRYEDAEKEGLLNCVNCGCCAYICPGGNPLVQNYVVAKNKIIAEKKKQAAKGNTK